MDKLVRSLVFLVSSLGFLRCCDANGTTTRGYVFTAPRTLLTGETESGCLSFHNLELPAHVILELVTPSGIPKEEVLASTSSVVKIETCLQLPVPSTEYTTGRLRLKIKFDKYPEYVVESEKEVEIKQDSLLTFVETDKPIYKPGQNVNIRILILRHDLKLWENVIPKVWISNPSQVRVRQWTNVSTEHGMAQLAFPLSPEPNSGTWTINVEAKVSHERFVQSTTFEVEKYVLPRFQVVINSPEYILADAENVTWNICVKYSYGKPVKGTLLLKLTPRTPSWRRKPNLPAIRSETEFDKPDGCTEFVLSGKVLELANWKVNPNNIILVAEFTEAGTGIMETAISRTEVMHEALKLEFANYMPKYFNLGLPYYGKLRVLRHDDTPAPNEKIQVCLKVRGKIDWSEDFVECRYFTSSIDGFVDFVVPPQNKNVVFLSFIATAVNYPTKYYSPDKRWKVFMDQPSGSINVNSWYSPSNSYLTVASGNQPIVCGEKYSFNVMYTAPSYDTNEAISFYYSINSKGGILIYGQIKHKPNRDTILDYSEFRNLFNPVEFTSNETRKGPVVHRFPLSVKITPTMAPVSELLLYYVRYDGEIVATTYTIDVGHCFKNKVKTAWHTDVQTPGSTAQYHVEAAPWSLCGISAVDKSTLFLSKSKSNMVSATKVFDQLQRFHPIAEPLSMWHCKSTKKDNALKLQRKRRYANAGSVNYVDVMQAFVDFGVVVMSDLVLETRPCPPFVLNMYNIFSIHSLSNVMKMSEHFESAVAAAARYPEVDYVDELLHNTETLRSYFPETWLWELIPTGKEGKVTIERNLPHTITDWVGYTTCISPTHGLGIAPPTTITAFQSFFLDYSLPYSVKRGEIVHLKVSLFNYMQHSLPVRIELEDIDGIDLHLSEPKVAFCIKPRDSIVHDYVLKPRVIGEVNITVTAFIDTDYPESCGPQSSVSVRDTIVKPILILPEGFPVEETKSMFVCPVDFNEDSKFVWELLLPEDIVPDSGRAYLNLIGDVLGPALDNLDKLVQLPRGCGEQNMILLVPNIHVITYLDAIGVDNPSLRAEATKNMEKGYQRELNYRQFDGSYATFSGGKSSIWLTAFVLKSFAQARNFIYIDERDLELTANWIMAKQLDNGCFPAIGGVFRKQMMGGLDAYGGSPTALTAYILLSLLESDVPLPRSVVNNGLKCLEKGKANGDASTYTMVLTTYVLALLEYPKVNCTIKSLMNIATRSNNLVWWEDKTKPSTGLSIELTAYAILSLLKLKGEQNMIDALKAVRWISKQRNAQGGFKDTQDTVIGLKALTMYAVAVNHRATDLSVVVTATEVDYIYRLHDANRMVLTQIRLPVLPTVVEIFAEGEGCALVQSNIKYNIHRTTGSEAFDIAVGARSASRENECSLQEITVCARYQLADEESNMALLEVGMISGYVPDRESLHSLLQPSSRVKRFEDGQDMVTVYFDKLTSQKTCVSFKIIREYVVDRLEPANVKLYDYYQQELTVSASYEIASICSSADPIEEQAPKNIMGKTNLKSSFSLDSSFLVLDHQLETPDGMEGPIPVYMKPNTFDYKMDATFTTNGVPDFTPIIPIEDRTVLPVQIEEQEFHQEESDIEIKNTTINTETNIPSPTGEKQSCPICMDNLPSDVSNVYCSASAAVKVAIRRSRKARLLLDLHPSHQIQRLRLLLELTLNTNCSCSPIDAPGSFALIVNKDKDFLASGEHKQTLNDAFYIYGLPLISGIPCKLAEARATCSNEENIQCNIQDPLVYS